MATFAIVTVTDQTLQNCFTQTELRRYKVLFDGTKSPSSSFLTVNDLQERSERLGFKSRLSDGDVAKMLELFDVEKVGGLTFEGFLRLQADIDSGSSYFSPLTKPKAGSHGASKDFMRSPIYSTCHVVNDSEKMAYVDHINAYLVDDPHVKHLLPISRTGTDFVDKIKSGILLCKLVNVAVPGTIDVRAINIKAKLNAWEQNENITLCINSARAIGCQVSSIGPQEVTEGREHLVVALVAQIVKLHLLSSVNFKAAKELLDAPKPESDSDTDEENEEQEPEKESAEQLLFRWMNHYLAKAGYKKEVRNFSHDLKDGEAYTHLLAQLAPGVCDLSPLEAEGTERAQRMLQQAEKVGCRKFLQPKDVEEGNANLNLAFIANLFNASRDGGLLPKPEEPKVEVEEVTVEQKSDEAEPGVDGGTVGKSEGHVADGAGEDDDDDEDDDEEDDDDGAKDSKEEGKSALVGGSAVPDNAQPSGGEGKSEELEMEKMSIQGSAAKVEEDDSDDDDSDDDKDSDEEDEAMKLQEEQQLKQKEEVRKKHEEEELTRQQLQEARRKQQQQELEKQQQELREKIRRKSDEDEAALLDEERMYRLWINSLGVASPVHNIFQDLRDGISLLEILDKVKPGCVLWTKIHRPSEPGSSGGAGKGWRGMYKKLENCQQALDVGRSLNLSLVGIGSDHIAAGNRKFLLAFLWQLMRLYTLRELQHLRHDHELTDSDILAWAVEQVQESQKKRRQQKVAGEPARPPCAMPESFKDRSLSSGVFLLELMSAVEPRVVNWAVVMAGSTEDEKMENSQYIISVARKLGCSTFLVVQDIVQVRPKKLLMLMASIMAFHLQRSMPRGSAGKPKLAKAKSPGASSPNGTKSSFATVRAAPFASTPSVATSLKFEDSVKGIMPDWEATPVALRKTESESLSPWQSETTPPVHRFSNGLFGPTVGSARKFSTPSK